MAGQDSQGASVSAGRLIRATGLLLMGVGILLHLPVLGWLGIGLTVLGLAVRPFRGESEESVPTPQDP